MKNIKHLLAIVVLASLAACEKDNEIALYKENAGVYFYNTMEDSYNFILNPDLEVDTFINDRVRISGSASDVDRYFKAEIVESDETNALQGQFELLQGVVPANSYTGYLPIKLNRTAEMDTATFSIEYTLVASDDFPMIDFASENCKISCTAGFVKPAMWFLFEWDYGTYSNTWFKFILSVCKDYEFYNEADWSMSNNDWNTHYDYVSMVKLALAEYNNSHDEPLKHDDGSEVVMP